MKITLVLSLMLIQFVGLSQRKIQGSVTNSEGAVFQGVEVIEVNTENKTITDVDGKFELNTTRDSCSISFVSWEIGAIETVIVTSDTTLNTQLVFVDYYNTRWISFGANYGLLNQVFGFHLSNAVDEIPLIHFEDFQDNILVKVHGQTDLSNNYSYGGEFGLVYIRHIGQPSLRYEKVHFENADFFLTDLNLKSLIRYFGNTGVAFLAGYQKLNDIQNYGLGLGFEGGPMNFHFAASSRYYFDYFHHEINLQVVIPSKNLLTFQAEYSRIDRTDLLTVGLNYAFVRNNK